MPAHITGELTVTFDTPAEMQRAGESATANEALTILSQDEQQLTVTLTVDMIVEV